MNNLIKIYVEIKHLKQKKVRVSGPMEQIWWAPTIRNIILNIKISMYLKNWIKWTNYDTKALVKSIYLFLNKILKQWRKCEHYFFLFLVIFYQYSWLLI